MHFFLSKMKGQTARRNLPSLLVRARGGDELTVGKFLETLSRGCGCGPSRLGLGLNSDLKSALSKPSSNSCISSNSSASISPSYCSRSTDLGTETERERVQSLLRATCSLSASNIHTPASYSPAKSPAQGSRIRSRDQRRDKVISAWLSVSIKKPPLGISRGMPRQPEFDSNQI